MDANDFRAIASLFISAAFAGLFFWLWVRRSASDFDAAARLPFSEPSEPVSRGAVPRSDDAGSPPDGKTAEPR